MRGTHPRPAPPQEDRVPSAVAAYDELWRMIRHGELAPGTSLGEVQCAELLGVSRTPVREAFARLLTDGVLVEGARRQVVVTALEPVRIDELVLLRQALEPTMTRHAAGASSPSATDLLRLIQIQARRAGDAGDAHRFWDCDDEFHHQVPIGAGLRQTGETIRSVRRLLRVGLVNRQELTPARVEETIAEHEAVIEALTEGDGHRAEAAMAAHLEAACRRAGLRASATRA